MHAAPRCATGSFFRLLALGLLLPQTRAFLTGTSAAHPPCGGPLPSARRIAAVRAVVLADEVVAPASPDEPPGAGQPQLLAGILRAGLQRAADDRRRVDELVTHFEYDGAVDVPAEGRRASGQGEVKRLLTALFADNEVGTIEVDSDGASVLLSLRDSTDRRRTLRLLATGRGGASRGGGARHGPKIAEVVVHELLDGPAARAESVFGGGGAVVSEELLRPKWETFDGRVRQRIWPDTDLFARGNLFLKEKLELTTGRLIMVVDSAVMELYGPRMEEWAESADLRLELIVAHANEDRKSLATFTFLLDELKRADPLRRSEPVLCVGGGVLTDTAGFACACWRRGIPWCRLPTTLLGIVDASVGIKVAINYHRKNGVGHFYSPLHTFIDTSFLDTVSRPDIRSGCGEIMKAAIIHDARLYELLDAHGEEMIAANFRGSPEAERVIQYSIDAMLECIGPDLWEEALLRPMDYGHTFSRTLEADESFFLRHGEAVAVDSLFSALIAEAKGLLPSAQADSLLSLYRRLGLPCSIAGITAATYKKARDEIVVHRDGLLRAPLPAGIGRCEYVDEIDDGEIDAAFARLTAFTTEHADTVWDISKSFAAE